MLRAGRGGFGRSGRYYEEMRSHRVSKRQGRAMKKITILVFIAAALAALATGCLENFSGEQYTNEPPEVWLSSAPPEGSVNSYFIHLYWGGWDPDGVISHFQYVITNNPPEGIVINDALFESFERDSLWKNVSSNDSTFVFSADLPADTTNPDWVAEFRRSHTFFIRAVDDHGAITSNDKIVYRTFTARTLSPTVDILVPTKTGPASPAMVPPITTFKWTARDYIDQLSRTQDPDSVRWILTPLINHSFDETVDYIRHAPDSSWTSVSDRWPTGWIPYKAPGDSGKFAVSPTMDIGQNYIFAVQAKDEAGAVTSTFDEAHNVRRILAAHMSTGPILTVFNRFVGNLSGASVSTPLVIFDLPEGVPLQFKWSASADYYGGLVVGYRYGWDVVDPNNDEDWEIDFTNFVGTYAYSPPRTFFFGSHTFHVEVIDNSGLKTRVGFKVNIIPFTMTKDLLMVDDFLDGLGITETKGAIPNDEEHDAFWLQMLQDVSTFDPLTDMIEVDRSSDLPIEQIAKYKSIIWDVMGKHNALNTVTMLYQLIKFKKPSDTGGGGKVQPNMLSLFMAAGGHVLICGTEPMSMSVNRSYFLSSSGAKFPLILLYESGGDQDGSYRDGPIGSTSFAYNEFCLDVLDVSASAVQYRSDFCPVGRRSIEEDGMKVAIRDDYNDYNGYQFPDSIPLDPIVTQPGYFYENVGYSTELYNPRYFACDTALITYKKRPRSCMQPMFRQMTMNPNSVVDNTIVATWTSTYADVVPPNGIPARSALWGFEPYYFDHDKIKQALDVILFGEWQLPHK